MRDYLLEREQLIHRPLGETFAFFSDAFNLERITPAFLRFRILTRPPIQMAAGMRIEYQLSLYGVRFCWETRIERWVPGEYFVDVQTRGPYRRWRHRHTFRAVGPDCTLIEDRVEYQLGFGILGRLAQRLFVGPALKRIFDFRQEAIAEWLGPEGQGPAPMASRRAVTGFASEVSGQERAS